MPPAPVPPRGDVGLALATARLQLWALHAYRGVDLCGLLRWTVAGNLLDLLPLQEQEERPKST